MSLYNNNKKNVSIEIWVCIFVLLKKNTKLNQMRKLKQIIKHTKICMGCFSSSSSF